MDTILEVLICLVLWVQVALYYSAVAEVNVAVPVFNSHCVPSTANCCSTSPLFSTTGRRKSDM